jgi:hypothetical protein
MRGPLASAVRTITSARLQKVRQEPILSAFVRQRPRQTDRRGAGPAVIPSWQGLLRKTLLRS